MSDVRRQIAELICELNIWNTPKAIKDKIGYDLSQDEIRIAMGTLESIVPYNEWIKFWREQRSGGPTETTPKEKA